MSDEQRIEEEEVEAHRRAVAEEQTDETETDDEVEAHIRKATPRKI